MHKGKCEKELPEYPVCVSRGENNTFLKKVIEGVSKGLTLYLKYPIVFGKAFMEAREYEIRVLFEFEGVEVHIINNSFGICLIVKCEYFIDKFLLKPTLVTVIISDS